MFGAGDFVLLCASDIETLYKADVILTYWIILKTLSYHSYRKLFWFMSISIEIEKDLKM